MDEKYANEEFLTRWIANELTDKELSDFQQTDIYKEVKFIYDQAGLLSSADIDTEAALSKVKEKLDVSSKSKVPKKLITYAIAASISLIVGFLTIINWTVSYEAEVGSTKLITLADGSVVQLNSNSTLKHKRFFWSKNKQVTLDGEAFFKVVKNDHFKVNTQMGAVAVLGTEFNVKNRMKFSVECYEGKISFEPIDASLKEKILTAGMGIKIEDGEIEDRETKKKGPEWISGVTTYKNAPLSEVLQDLEGQFNVKIELKSTRTDRLFTGQFQHKDLKTALETTLKPMGIVYKEDIENNIILLED